jgi:prephenate dehydrogenase
MNTKELQKLRLQIDSIDQQIQNLMQQRANYAIKVGEFKLRTEKTPVFYRPEREAEIINKIQERNHGPLSNQDLDALFSLLMQKCRQLQQHLIKTTIAKTKQKQLTIIGLGLIGGSIAMAAKASHLFEKIVAYDIDKKALSLATKVGIIDMSEKTITAAAKNADLIMIAVPIEKLATVLKQIKPALNKNTIITDVISVKQSVAVVAKKILGAQFKQFVLGHPIAGSEKQGITAAKAGLFNHRTVVLTPDKQTQPTAIKTVTLFWQQLGSQIEILTPQLHDQFLATTSHLPQLLTYAYAANVGQQKKIETLLKFTGSGFRDFTRLARSHPNLWIGICLANRQELLKQLGQLQKTLTNIQSALQKQNAKKLKNIFTMAACFTKNPVEN